VARQYYEEIDVAAKRLLRIVEILEFFASSGGGLIHPHPLDVRRLVEEVVTGWAGRDHDTPDVLGDERWLVLAIDELIDNAVKFSPDGGSVTVAATATSTRRLPAGGVDISVADQGQGMTPEQRTAAFGEFVQGDGSDTRRFGGLGLGLSLVQRVVESHGGTVTCVSTAGQGSVFTINLPAMPTNALVQS
jgi:signal transduction histidine kinase